MADTVRQRLLCETNNLVILVPDLRSVARVRALLQYFQEQEQVFGQNFTPHFLLNQYDPASPLHQDLRRSLAEHLGERLLPFTLRRTDDLALALAEGATIVDYAPGSGIAEDFLRLADWLTMWQGTQAEGAKGYASAGGCR
jgi:cellulose biosynthesis protein BcsQ